MVTPCMVFPRIQNTVPSLTIFSGGPPSARNCLAMLRPAVQVPPCRICASGKLLAIHVQPRAHDFGQAVEQRHGQRAPLHHQFGIDAVLALRRGRIAQRQHAGVDEQPAVAIFRQAGEPVDVGDLDAGPLQRLDQRIGEPLRQLVQRHEAVGLVVGLQRGMLPAIAERDAAERQPRRPDRPEMRQHFRQDDRRGDPLVLGQRGQMIEQPAGTRRVVAAENLRRGHHRPAKPAQQVGAPGDAWQRIVVRHLEAAMSLASVSSASIAASTRNGQLGHFENSQSRNITRLASARPSERPTYSPLTG